jgi:hypothetical protein
VPALRLQPRLAAVRAVRTSLAAAVLLLAASAAGGELVRYRAADGTIGLVDHASKLPPGATVLQTSKQTERAAEPEPVPDAEPVRERRRLFDRTARAKRRAAADEPSAEDVESWCQRGRAAEERVERAERRLESAEESYDLCNDHPRYECSRTSLDAAEREIDDAQEAQNQVEADCRSSGCDPGWLRCSH